MSKLTALGVGNILMSDEGVGVRLLEAVRACGGDWPGDLEFVDGGAGGLNLLGVIEEAQALAVFDAADMGLSPGETRVITAEQLADDDAPDRLSLHDMPLVQTLKLCEQFTRRPATVRILAIQPKTVEFGRELSPELQAAMPSLLAAARKLLAEMLGELG
jgi:hydrogenase maturation protease